MKNIKIKDIAELFDDCYINLYDVDNDDDIFDGERLGKDENVTNDEYWSIFHMYDNYKVEFVSPNSFDSITIFVKK